MSDGMFDNGTPETDMARIAYTSTKYIGRHFEHEKNDCAVRALMTVSGGSYPDCHEMLRVLCGRQDRRGTSTYRLVRMMDNIQALDSTLFGAKVERVSLYKSCTLAQFVRNYPVGTYYVLKYGHAFAIVDGVVIDTWEPGARCRVKQAWRVISPKTAVVAPKAVAPKAAAPKGAVIASITKSGKARLPTALIEVLRAKGAAGRGDAASTMNALLLVVTIEVYSVMSDRQIAWATKHIIAGYNAANQ